MELETYISDLLYRYECVTVPGLGAFLAHKVPARLDAEKHTFFPPKKRVSFNAQLKDNDGLLTNYTATAEAITYEAALVQVQNYRRFVIDRLENKGEIFLKDLGTLSQDGEGNISFEPDADVNYLTESFGLSSYAMPPINREVYKKEIAALEEKAPILITPERRTASPWLKYAAIGLLAVGLAGFGGYRYVEGVEAHNFAEKQKAATQLEDQIQQATFTIANPLPAITLNAFKPTGKYHIVAGAFRSEENATTRVVELREKGYKARQIGANRYGLHQVVYGSYTDSEEALVALRAVRTQDNKGAWMLVKELEN